MDMAMALGSRYAAHTYCTPVSISGAEEMEFKLTGRNKSHADAPHDRRICILQARGRRVTVAWRRCTWYVGMTLEPWWGVMMLSTFVGDDVDGD